MTARVLLDLSIMLPGAIAARILEHEGWMVTKVVPPGGDPMRQLDPRLYGHYVDEESVVEIDLKSDSGQAELDRLLADADVVLESYRDRTARRLGVTEERTGRSGTGLVSIRGYRLEDDNDLPGHDITYMAASGAAAMLSRLTPGGVTPYWGSQISNFLGGMAAALAVTHAVPGRRSVVGLDAILANMLEPKLLTYAAEGEMGLYRSVYSSTYRFYRTRDGRQVALGIKERKYQDALAAVIGTSVPIRASTVERWIGARSLSEVSATLRQHGLPHAPVRSLSEVLELRPIAARWNGMLVNDE